MNERIGELESMLDPTGMSGQVTYVSQSLRVPLASGILGFIEGNRSSSLGGLGTLVVGVLTNSLVVVGGRYPGYVEMDPTGLTQYQ